jgi:hypothetical protein
MRHGTLVRILLLMGGAVLLASCGSPAKPDPRCTGTTGLWATCEPHGNGLQCSAREITYCGPRADVTTSTTWSSADPDIATVTATGFVQSVSPGETLIHANYRGVPTVVAVKVIPGHPPLPVFEIDAQVLAGPACSRTKPGVPGVLITVTGGLNAGASATTDEHGTFALPDMVVGPITLRASKPGYQDVTVTGGFGQEGIPTICITPEH